MFDEYERNKRVYEGYTIQQTDPYSHWIVLDPKGKRVKEITSVFTTTRDALSSLKEYLHKKG